MALLLKVHPSPEGNLVAVCDKEILGKRFEDGKVVLDVKKDFFGGKAASKKALSEALIGCYSATIFGNEAVEVALKCKAISEGGVKSVSGVKYALLFRL